MIDKVKLRIELKKRKDKVERELRDVKESISKVESDLAEIFVDQGVASMSAEGYNVILIKIKTVGCDQSESLVQFLEENGYDDVFNKPVNTNALRSIIKNNPEIEDLIAEHIEIGEIYRFKVTKK